MKKLKTRYNAILIQQEKAVKWFQSEDFHNKFREQGEAFFDRAFARWTMYEEQRVKILKELEAQGERITTEQILLGFEL